VIISISFGEQWISLCCPRQSRQDHNTCVVINLVINARSFGHHYNNAMHSGDELHMTADH